MPAGVKLQPVARVTESVQLVALIFVAPAATPVATVPAVEAMALLLELIVQPVKPGVVTLEVAPTNMDAADKFTEPAEQAAELLVAWQEALVPPFVPKQVQFTAGPPGGLGKAGDAGDAVPALQKLPV